MKVPLGVAPESQQSMDMISKVWRQKKTIWVWAHFIAGVESGEHVHDRNKKKKNKRWKGKIKTRRCFGWCTPVLVAVDAYDLAKEQKPSCDYKCWNKRHDAVAGDACPIPCDPIPIPFHFPPIDRCSQNVHDSPSNHPIFVKTNEENPKTITKRIRVIEREGGLFPVWSGPA